jgi:ferredoxin
MLRSRFFCGTLCPAGTILGALNVLALVRVRLDAGACTSCGVCERVCRTGCIDAKKKRHDPWGCVQCLDCIVVCPHGALRYGTVRRGAARVCSRSSLKTGRLEFLKTSAAALAAAAGVASLRFLPERAGMEPRSRSASARAMAVPPGAMSVERYAARCTACATCVRACPPGVLRLSLLEFGITRPLVPWLDYGRAFCQYECTACGEVCPSGAILKLEKPVKKLTAIGKSELVLAKCIIVEKKTACGACAEHCPSGAVRMVRDSGYDLPIPKLVISTCIGCGACETICPSKPEKAIVVSGISVHEIADKPATYDDEIPELSDEFPF